MPEIRRLHELPAALRASLLSPHPAGAGEVGAAALREVVWEELAEDLESHSLSPLLARRIEEAGLADQIPAGLLARWRAAGRHFELQCALQRLDAERLSRHFVRCGIPHAFFKGFVYRELYYRPSWVRPSGDVDLLVARRDVERARAAMRELGFFQATCTDDCRQFRPAPQALIESTEARHYELAQFARVHRLINLPAWFWGPDFVRRPPCDFERTAEGDLFNSCVDVHWTVHFMFAGEPMLERVEWHGSLPFLGLEWSLLTTAFKLYFESFDHVRRGFLQLVDLAALLAAALRADPWPRVGEVVSRLGLEAAAYYAFAAAQDWIGVELVPGELLARWSELRDGSAAGRQNLDFGDFIPYLIGRRSRAGFAP
jgi:hypothetical protein